ncbi:hypothetical protein Glove_280g13 [Diversispora epigaea]|uniref:Uncharacterized protein n=1 Tax=Diversispora epigaea TaxID=1348612 RepID=A0A397I7E9_9GLOM|nr:hypothetical protein Glove_280g13 [Diversispora epigaea]
MTGTKHRTTKDETAILCALKIYKNYLPDDAIVSAHEELSEVWTVKKHRYSRSYSSLKKKHHNLEHSTDHNLEYSTDYNLEHNTDHNLEHSTDHNLEYSTDHNLEHSTDYNLEHSTDHNLEHSTDHNLEHN